MTTMAAMCSPLSMSSAASISGRINPSCSTVCGQRGRWGVAAVGSGLGVGDRGNRRAGHCGWRGNSVCVPQHRARGATVVGHAGGCSVALLVFAPLALVSWYPTAQMATLVAHDIRSGTVRWESMMPATHPFAIERTANELAVIGRIDDRCDFRLVTIRIDAATGRVLTTTPGGDRDRRGPYLPGRPAGLSPGEVGGLRWDMAVGRIVSAHGWSIRADPAEGPVSALVTGEVTYLAEQGHNYLSCSR